MHLVLGSRSERGGARRAPTKRVYVIPDRLTGGSVGSGAQSLGDSGATRLTAECLLRHEALMGQAGGKSQEEGDQMEEGDETGDGGVMSASTVKTFATDFR